MTRLVVCCDGTWNTPKEARGPTNVYKLADSLKQDNAQAVHYEKGVGTRWDEKVIGGAFGYGLSRNIRSCYRWLVETYKQGDELFLFGFSRGAYTARSLAGLIRNCGILRLDQIDELDRAWAFYRNRDARTHPSSDDSAAFRRTYAYGDQDIAVVGVWDTVGALGIPLPVGVDRVLKRAHIRQPWAFHDTQLSSRVHHAFHALAIDEQRNPFQPTLWTNDPVADQTLEQVWFTGVHSEIGGGASDTGLSDIALLWMVARAMGCGLELVPGRLQVGGQATPGHPVRPRWSAPLVDSRTGVYKLLPRYRRLQRLAAVKRWGQSVASSVGRRRRDPELHYGPPGLDDYLAVMGKPTDVVDES